MAQPKIQHRERLAVVPKSGILEVHKFQYIICPNCAHLHGLFYRQHVNTKTLHYLCNKVKGFWWSDGGTKEHWRCTTAVGDVEFVDGLPIRTEETGAVRMAAHKKAQLQLVMMKDESN